ncbi:PilW family protein [bacterium]|nr:PilW family protein [bacterium]
MSLKKSLINKKSPGFTLVELLIAMVLGLVIVGGGLYMFSGIVQSSVVNQSVSTLQSNGRFAIDLIGRDVRSAGFIGCVSNKNSVLNIVISNPPTTDLNDTAITGYYVQSSTNWSPANPDSYTAPTGVGEPVQGTYVLGVQYAQFPGYALGTSMSSPGDTLALVGNDDISVEDGQAMIISDCSSADLFSVSSLSTGTSGGTSGDATDDTSTETTDETTDNSSTVTMSANGSLTKAYPIPTFASEGTRVMPFISTLFYIGDTQRTTASGDSIHSLFAHSYPYSSTSDLVELVEGVDQLVVEFGVRQADGSQLYETPGTTASDLQNIETLKLGLLLTSSEHFGSVDVTRAYNLAGKSITPAAAGSTGLTYPNDNRMRMPFNATFNLRNRDL